MNTRHTINSYCQTTWGWIFGLAILLLLAGQPAHAVRPSIAQLQSDLVALQGTGRKS